MMLLRCTDAIIYCHLERSKKIKKYLCETMPVTNKPMLHPTMASLSISKAAKIIISPGYREQEQPVILTDLSAT